MSECHLWVGSPKLQVRTITDDHGVLRVGPCTPYWTHKDVRLRIPGEQQLTEETDSGTLSSRYNRTAIGLRRQEGTTRPGSYALLPTGLRHASASVCTAYGLKLAVVMELDMISIGMKLDALSNWADRDTIDIVVDGGKGEVRVWRFEQMVSCFRT